MDQQAEREVLLMYDAMKSSGDPDIRMRTLRMDLREFPDSAIIEAAQRFRYGEVPGQSMKFAPEVPEFRQEVKNVAKMQAMRAAPAPRIEHLPRSGPSPFEIVISKHKGNFDHRPKLHDNVTHEKARQIAIRYQGLSKLR
jgi:hypothetical protein